MPGDWFIAPSGGGSSIVDFDTCLGIRYKTGSALPVKPVENGSFFTANKWAFPFQAVVELAKASRDGGGDLAQVMQDLEQWKNSVDLVDVVTPYKVFIHANLFDLEYRFDNDETGAGMIVPVVTLQEVRLVGAGDAADIGLAGAANPDCVTRKDNGQASPRECNPARYARGAEAGA